jgi:hypothetical protein
MSNVCKIKGILKPKNEQHEKATQPIPHWVQRHRSIIGL